MLPPFNVDEEPKSTQHHTKAANWPPFLCAAFLAAVQNRTTFQQLTLETRED